MSTDASDGRHTARKNAARDIRDRTGMPYAAALRHVTRTEDAWRPRHRWIITDDLRDWIDGRTWRGTGYPDLREWLDSTVSPAFDCCDWCDEPGDARDEDCFLELLITAYDPDVQPATMHVGTRKLHARCKPLRDASPMFGRPGAEGTSIAWLRRAAIPSGPQRISLPASARPEVAAEFELEARALLLAPGWWYGHDHTGQAVLLVTARVTEDHGQGPRPWLTELELHLNREGLGHPDSMDGGECGWALRVVTDARPWIALRTSQAEDMEPQHLLLLELDLPDGWAEAARRDGKVTVAIGPCTAHWDDVAPGLLGDLARDPDDNRALRSGRDEDSCACETITAGQVAELIDAHVVVTAGIRVITAEQS
jgi:hypothetical protein